MVQSNQGTAAHILSKSGRRNREGEIIQERGWMRKIMGRGVEGGGWINGEKLMRKKKRGGGKQERDLITVGSKGIKTEMRETCVIAPLSWINTNREGCSVCHIVQLRCELYCDLLCNVCHTMNKPPEKWSKQLLLFFVTNLTEGS